MLELIEVWIADDGTKLTYQMVDLFLFLMVQEERKVCLMRFQQPHIDIELIAQKNSHF